MTLSTSAVVRLLQLVFADNQAWPRWPKPLHLIQGALLVQGGMDLAEASKVVGTRKGHLAAVVGCADPLAKVLGITEADVPEETVDKLRRNIGQLVLGRAAEISFEEICKAGIDSSEYSLADVREGRSNTDYRLLDSAGRKLYRFNVKYFGSVFRRGVEMVKLDPSDCFALATYKIYAALQQQEREHLPYVFAIVGVANLTAEAIAEAIPEDEVRPVAALSASTKVTRSRDYEDWLVERIVAARSPAFQSAYSRIRNAEWFVLSARKADNLVHELLYDRVYALTVPRFTRQFGGAEVDMHFSISKDLIPLQTFLSVLKQEGQGKITSMLERGTY